MSIRDVAKRAGVGVGTVSRVLNNGKNVSDSARQRVEQAMRELNYTPNELARNLYRRRSNIVGFMIPNVENPFFGTLTRFVETELYRCGYKMMLCNTVSESNRERQYLEMLNRKMMDGLIIGSHSMSVKEYVGIAGPIVSFDRVLGETIPIVRSDHLSGGRLAAEKLLADGCRYAVQLMGCRGVDTPAHLHHVSFQKVMEEGGACVKSLEMGYNRFDYADYEALTREIFERFPDADAVYGADLSVCAALKDALRRGKRVPEDLELVAYDGTYVTRLAAKEVTSVVQPIERLARTAVEAVICLIETGQTSPEALAPLPVSLRLGETTR